MRGTFNAHTNPAFVTLKVLKFKKNMIKLQIGKVMYLNKNRLLPESVNDMFLLSQCDVHEHYIRTKNFSSLPHCRTNHRKEIFLLRLQSPKLFYYLRTELTFKMPLVLLSTPLNLSHLSFAFAHSRI